VGVILIQVHPSLTAVYNSQITNCVFQSSSSYAVLEAVGGALTMQSVGSIVIADCLFVNNSATSGGGVLLLDSGVSFFRNEFMNNTAVFLRRAQYSHE